MIFELKQHFQIESARYLPNLPVTHPCGSMHGHSFKIVLTLRGALDPKLGWLIDYNEITDVMNPLLKQLDHKVLNKVPGLENPTTELLCKWIYDNAVPLLPAIKSVTVMETSSTECTYPAI
jgi:6-pyruvoyltetrahydropterin/6-carboxytetrahydropterin synthase